MPCPYIAGQEKSPSCEFSRFDLYHFDRPALLVKQMFPLSLTVEWREIHRAELHAMHVLLLQEGNHFLKGKGKLFEVVPAVDLHAAVVAGLFCALGVSPP
jgi:hypothetical protein